MDSMALDILQAPSSDTNHCYYEPHNPESGHSGQGCAQILILLSLSYHEVLILNH